MRGIVTLAAALALPTGEPPFPQRDLMVFCAFCVVLSTLVLQGMTLRPLMQRLGLRDDGTVVQEIGVARVETARAALRALQQEGAAAHLLRSEYLARLQTEESSATAVRSDQDDSLAALQRQAVAAQREALTDLRSRQVVGDDAFHVVEEEIDLLELTAPSRVHPALDSPSS